MVKSCGEEIIRAALYPVGRNDVRLARAVT
jgi:hypothetical protein